MGAAISAALSNYESTGGAVSTGGYVNSDISVSGGFTSGSSAALTIAPSANEGYATSGQYTDPALAVTAAVSQGFDTNGYGTSGAPVQHGTGTVNSYSAVPEAAV